MMGSKDSIKGPINLGNPNEFTIRQLAEMVIELTKSKSKLVFQELPSDDPRQRKPEISKAKSLLDWSPKVEIEQGLKDTIEYFKKILET